MIIRTAKGRHTAATFAALAAWQAEMQGAYPAIEIGEHSVDVDGAETAEEMVAAVRLELAEAIEDLRTETVWSTEEVWSDDGVALVADCDAASADTAALERVCAVLCDAHAQED